jgi:DNA-binding transcriptional LysR family regulator
MEAVMQDYVRFLAIANERSVSRAAERLSVSQPAMSRTIAQLEARLRTNLFKRTATGVELTGSGRILYEYASRAVRAIANAENDIEHAESRRNIILYIGAGDGWGFGRLPGLIRRFAEDNPNVDVTLEVADLEGRIEGLKNGRFDLAFGIVPPEFLATGTFEFLPMAEATFDVYCDRDHPLVRAGRPPSAEELRAYPWINHRPEFDILPRERRASGRSYSVRTNSMLSVVEIMRGSSFLVAASKWFHDFLLRSDLVRLCEDTESPVFRSGAIFPRKEGLRPHARSFLNGALASYHMGA